MAKIYSINSSKLIFIIIIFYSDQNFKYLEFSYIAGIKWYSEKNLAVFVLIFLIFNQGYTYWF